MSNWPPPFDGIQERCGLLVQPLFNEILPPLFHYTSGEGLLAILRTGNLRGSNFTFMNDRSEFTYGAALLRQLCEERLTSSTGEFERAILELAAQGEPPADADLYLTCFCEKGDLLSQWRGY